MNSKKQLIQHLKQFPKTKLVGHFLDLLRYVFEHLQIKEDASNLLCSIHSENNALYVQINNLPILIHKVRDRKHQLELLLLKENHLVSERIQHFRPSKQKVGKHLVGMAQFALSKELLQDKNIISSWTKAVQKLWEQPNKKNNNRYAHNNWVYRAATDMFVHNDILSEIEIRDKYQTIIPKAIEQLINRKYFQDILSAEGFYFQKAQDVLHKFQSIELVLEVYEDCLFDYKQFHGRFDQFVEETKDKKEYSSLLTLLGKLVAYIDEKATGKQVWNNYNDKRCVGRSGVRQNLWVQQLIQYKQAGNNLDAITTPIIKNALLYLSFPQEHTPVLSPSHQRQVANHLLDSIYQNNEFTLQLIAYFNKFKLQSKNYSNFTYLIKELLYTNEIQNLWRYTDEDIYQDELLQLQLSEPHGAYKLASNTRFPLNQVLYGPPGTGKTFESIRRAISIVENKHWTVIQQMDNNTIQKRVEAYIELGQIVFTTFHQSLSYEDFVEGIKPEVVNNQIHYKIKPGIFKDLAHKATKDPDKTYVIVLDEMNRGNVANIFGELITLLEEDKRLNSANTLKIQLPYSKELFALPPNLYVIATMNTTDRSIEQLDMALRRRFAFIEILPDSLLLSEDLEDINLRLLHETINQRILLLLDKDHLIGHAYFMSISSFDELQYVFKNQIIPLLLEYFYGDLAKVGLILGKAFVQTKESSYNRFANFDYEGMDGVWDKTVYEIKSFPFPKQAYWSIYIV